MFWKHLCFALPLCLAGAAQALVEETIDEKHPLAVTFSTASHNRIAVEEGAVEKIFADSALFSVGIDSATGNAFVNVLQPIESQPATLTVVTSSGAVQDLLVSSANGLSEQVLLKEAEEEEDLTLRRELSHAGAIDLLNHLLSGKVPFGYGQRAVEEQVKTLALPEPLAARLIQIVEGPFEVLEVYEITQLSNQVIVLSADAMKTEEMSWVFVNQMELRPDGTALCVVGHMKDGQ